MKRFFKRILFSILLSITPIMSLTGPAGLGIADAFKDLSEAELIKAIEESQKALEDLMTNGTPEQKAEFEKALSELAENLSPEDWKELQDIGEVYEKHNPSVLQPAAPKEPAKEKQTPVVEKKPESKPIPEKTKVSQFEASIKETLDLIIKNIDHMFHVLSAHRDLSHKLKLWEEKSSFQELKSLLIRLKKHIMRLSKNTDPENKIIIDNLHAFKKDLEAENKRITLAQDDFGLENPMTEEQSEHTLTRVTLVLSTGINNLLPSLTEFFKKYEPEALEEAKKKDSQKAKAKEHEKAASQRRPSSPYFSTAPSYYSGHDSYNQMPQRRYRPSDMHNGFHQGDNQHGSQQNAAQKEHKPDFGGFDMGIKRGTIQNGRAIQNPEKKKDDKKKKDGDKEDDEDKENSETKKKPQTKAINPNENFVQAISKYIESHSTKHAGSRFTEALSANSLPYPKFTGAIKTAPIIITPGVKNALNKNLETPDLEKLKRDIIAVMQAVTQSSSSEMQEIITQQANLIIKAIEQAQAPSPKEETHEDTAQDIDTIMNNAQVKDAISNATMAIQHYKNTEASAKHSDENIKKLDAYAKNVDAKISDFTKEIDDMASIINTLQNAIGNRDVPQSDLSKFIKSPTFINLENKIQKYEKAVKTFKANAEQQKNNNLACITPSDEGKYLDIQRKITELQGLATTVSNAKNSLSSFKQSVQIPYLAK